MSFLKGGNLRILATGTYFPQRFKVTEIADIDDPKGYIGWEHVCVCEGDMHPSEMAATALRTALSDAGRSPDELGFILSIGTFADYPLPWSLATEVCGILGCPKACVGIDLNAGCAGALVALSTLSGWLGEGTRDLGAIVCADRNSVFIERRGAPSQLAGFSDAASALVVAATSDTGVVSALTQTALEGGVDAQDTLQVDAVNRLDVAVVLLKSFDRDHRVSFVVLEVLKRIDDVQVDTVEAGIDDLLQV